MDIEIDDPVLHKQLSPFVTKGGNVCHIKSSTNIGLSNYDCLLIYRLKKV